jgi:hypothetical protein
MTDRNELRWRTSSRSSGGACVEVAVDGDVVHVRDSKNRSGPVLTFDRAVFRDFIESIREGGTPRQ